MYKELPVYGVDYNSIKILKNTHSVYNNDDVKLRLRHLPIIGVNDDDLLSVKDQNTKKIQFSIDVIANVLPPSYPNKSRKIDTTHLKVSINDE